MISPVLANMALDGLERDLRSAFPLRRNHDQVHFIRYADDFVITGRSKAVLEQHVRPRVEQFMHTRGLELSAEKTSITQIEDGFDFLGQTIRKYNDVLLIKPSKQSVQTLLAKVRAIVKANPHTPAGKLILTLNPLIKGWTQYHRHVVSKKTFGAVDHAIFWTFWRWARRRHRNKSARWIRHKYIRSAPGSNWVFHGEVDGEVHDLTRAVRVPIRRHVKVKGAANPFDPTWEGYFEQRLGVKIAATLRGRRQLLRLWKEQDGNCPICNQPITELTGWHNHHIVWRSLGGSDRAANRILLHPTCHNKVHCLKLTVAKPRPKTGEREA